MSARAKRYIAIDQYGHVQKLRSSHPRKELLELMGRAHASKMYRDTVSSEGMHSGYVIAGYWFEVFEIRPAFAGESEVTKC